MRDQLGFAPFVAHLGTGPRKALALHCSLAFSGAWGGLARKAGADVTFVAPDMPSHGRSEDWDGTSSFADTAYLACLSCLTEPMDLIGHSFGGATALRLAVEHPELVRSLTMIEPVFFCVAGVDDPASVTEHQTASRPFFDTVLAGDMEKAARQFNGMWGDGPPWETIPEQVRAAMARAIHVVPDTSGFLFDDDANLLSRLDRATMPTLLIRGAQTMSIVETTNTGLARRLPNAQDVVLPGTGHMAPISHPQAVWDAWKPFLDGV